MSERHQEGLAHLLYGITAGGGFVALTGEVGTGKTTLCRCLLEQLPAQVDIALILNPKLNSIELLSSICDELGIAYREELRSLKHFVDLINRYLVGAYARGRTTVLLIDEAQNLSLEVLEQVRLLTNLETTKAKLLQIVLVGQPELKDLLSREELRQLNQRITARYHLMPLSLGETRAYIQHRLAVSNGDTNLFTDGAIRNVYKLSSGVPRVINILCDRAMLGAYATNTHTITPRIVNRAASEALGLVRKNPRMKALPAFVLIGCLAVGGYFLHGVTDSYWKGLEEVPSSKSESVAFRDWIDDPRFSLDGAMRQALRVWGKTLPDDHPVNCQNLAAEGLWCLTDKGNLNDLLEMDRPALLEFSMATGGKRYTLLTGVNRGQATLRFDEDFDFPVDEMEKLWTGNFLVLWQPPMPGVLAIGSAQASESVVWLRKQLNAANGLSIQSDLSPVFDYKLTTQVLEFQRRHHLTADGIVGARTLIQLENETGAKGSPHLRTDN
ncbi:MAG: AAA family ATPase [Gammaproteobacteria bacterium]